jgi:hypothetical protein
MSSTRFAIFFAFAALVSTVILIRSSVVMKSDKLAVWSNWFPSSADPLKYDAFVHHIAFRSVLGSLVSQYKVGSFTGQISDSWVVSPDQLQWTFHIRPGIKFENGDRVTAQDVVRSWCRMSVLLKQSGSRSDLFDAIEGFEGVQSIEANPAGLRAGTENLVIILKRPFPKMLETVAFGLYAIVHRSNFDQDTGKWLDSKKLISANAYRISEWTDKTFKLELRSDYPKELRHPRAFKFIELSNVPEARMSSDLIIGDSNDTSLGKNQYSFFGSTPSSIAYVHCYSWQKPDSICYTVEQRRALRSLFYDALGRAGIKLVRSFFPLGMQGISEVEVGDVRIHAPLKPFKFYLRRKFGNAYFDAIHSFLPQIAGASNSGAQETDMSLDQLLGSLEPSNSNMLAEVGVMATGILIEDPDADIRFMFLTKEGIRLPDTDGSIHKELSKKNYSAQRINELLIEQAVIFPIGHFAFGVWSKSSVDVSMLNTIQPPIEFNWIGSSD